MPTLWPLVPHPEITESLDWLTAVRRSATSEMRDALRDAPRQRLNYRFTRSGDFQAIETLFRSNPLGDWSIPVWHESSKAGTVQATDTELNVDLNASWSSQALIFGGKDNWQIVEIQSIGASLSLTASVGAAYANPTVVPLTTAVLEGGLSANRLNRRHTEVSLNFLSRDQLSLSGSGYLTHDGLPYFNCANSVLRPLFGNVIQEHQLVDGRTGSFDLIATRDLVVGSYMVDLTISNRSELMSFRRFLGDMRGRDRSFWIPAWNGRFQPITPLQAGASSAIIDPLYDNLSDYTARVVKIGNEFRSITSATQVGNRHQVNFAAISAAATFGRILQRVRLDTDRLTFQHRRGLASSCNFLVVEVPA